MDPLIEELSTSIESEEAKKPKLRESKKDTYKTLEGESEKERELILRENREILDMRKLWSKWILAFIGLIVGFDIVLVWMYGTGTWNFNDPAIIVAVIADNFLKILTMGIMITYFLVQKVYPNKK